MKNITLTIMAMLIASIAAFAQPPCEEVVKIQKEVMVYPPKPIITCPAAPPVPPPTGPNDERIVYWVHGLGGNSEAWARAHDASTHSEHNTSGFQARKLQSRKVSYGEYSSLLGATTEMRAQINDWADAQNTNNVDPNDNFIISHSQGGMVSSALLYKDFGSQPIPENERHYGGLVTVCSPLQGARIVNNTPTLLAMSGEACQELLAGPTTTTGFKILNWFTDVEEIVNNVCDFVEEDLMPAMFEGNTVPTTNDYQVGAAPINWFNNTPTPGIDRVAFYGVESQDNLLWKTMEHFVENPNNSTYWGANFEYGDLWDRVVENKLKYEDKYNEMQGRMNYLESVGFPCSAWQWVVMAPACAIWDTEYWNKKEKRDAWKRGVDWFNNINTDYLWAIGAKATQTSTSTYCECIDIDYEPIEENVFPGPCPPNSGPGSGSFCYEYTQTSTTVLNKPSDGVVLAESANNQGQLTAPPVQLNNTSHMQARNNTAIKNALTNLYNGAYGEFFATPVR